MADINIHEAENSKGEGKMAPTLIAFILDESSSMQTCKQSTISGFNEYKNSMKGDSEQCGEAFLSLTKFGTNQSQPRIDIVYEATPIDEAPDLDSTTYKPNGMTPLCDTIAAVIEHTQKTHSGFVGTKPRVVVVISTDGEENASKEYNSAKIRDLIKEKEQLGWNFVYLGASQDSWSRDKHVEDAAVFGMAANNVMAYDQTGDATALTYEHLSSRTREYRMSGQTKVKSFLKDGDGKTDDNK